MEPGPDPVAERLVVGGEGDLDLVRIGVRIRVGLGLTERSAVDSEGVIPDEGRGIAVGFRFGVLGVVVGFGLVVVVVGIGAVGGVEVEDVDAVVVGGAVEGIVVGVVEGVGGEGGVVL